MNQRRNTTNPFYVLVVVVGILFTLTASAYGVMIVKQTRPSSRQTPSGLITLMDRHGLTMMVVELSVLAIATCAAIGTDEYWSRSIARGGTTPRRQRTMKVNHYESVAAHPVDMQGAQGCTVRWLVGQAEGAPNFAMRQFEIAPGGHTPHHHHPYEHEVFVLEGNGVVLEGDRQHVLRAGDVIFVPPDEIHQFRNTGGSPMKFLCLVPNSAANQPVSMAPECGVDARDTSQKAP